MKCDCMIAAQGRNDAENYIGCVLSLINKELLLHNIYSAHKRINLQLIVNSSDVRFNGID